MTHVRLVTLALAAMATTALEAETATIAVAANFLAPLEALQREFEATTQHELTLVAGSTGQLYAQITNGAPFDVLLSADEEHAARLVADGQADGAERFTYAIGKLVLFTRETRFSPLSLDTLRRSDYRWLAIANPDVAPYGLAAQQTLEALGLWETLAPRLVRGQSITQAFAMAATQGAELALVALSQARAYEGAADFFAIPAGLYEPLRQDAVLLRHGAGNTAARAFLELLRGATATRIIVEQGYDRATDQPPARH